jgi:hypothetical protein
VVVADGAHAAQTAVSVVNRRTRVLLINCALAGFGCVDCTKRSPKYQARRIMRRPQRPRLLISLALELASVCSSGDLIHFAQDGNDWAISILFVRFAPVLLN